MIDARRALGVATAVVLGVGVYALREATETRSIDTPADSRTVVEVRARTNAELPGLALGDVVSAALTTCRLELDSSSVAGANGSAGPDAYRIVLAPALDETERVRYEGCLEDWRIDHVRIDVVTMRTELGGR
jgi:hypothetical protein